MPKYPNQKTIRIDKPAKMNEFAVYDLSSLSNACKVLNYSALRVYLYLLSNKSQIDWDISPSHAEKVWGIKRTSWYDGYNELIEKGFIYDKAIHHSSTKPYSEIRKKERAAENNEVRTNDSTKKDKEIYEARDSNNIKNNIKNNRDICFADIPDVSKREIDGVVKASSIDWNCQWNQNFNYNWRSEVDENGCWVTPQGKYVKVDFDN